MEFDDGLNGHVLQSGGFFVGKESIHGGSFDLYLLNPICRWKTHRFTSFRFTNGMCIDSSSWKSGKKLLVDASSDLPKSTNVSKAIVNNPN
jgi:hypothetical protein